MYSEKEGTGASRRSRKPRPAWTAALADLDDGSKFQTLIVWALDRADRRGAVEIGRLLDAHADGSRRVVGVDGTDTSDTRRRLEMIIRAEVAREEAEHIAERVTRAKRFARSDGRWLGGPPPYGTRVVEGRIEPDPETGPIARKYIADKLLAGETLWAVVKGLNADDIPAPRGGKWAVGTVAALVRAPGWAGLQSVRERTASGNWRHIAEVYYEDGVPVTIGQGIVTPNERSLILAKLASRSIETTFRRADGAVAHRGKRGVTSLLGDLLRCATCGGRTAVSGNPNHKSYRCGNSARGKGCPGFTAPVKGANDAVAFAFLSKLAALDPGDELLEAVADAWVARVNPETVSARAAALADLEAARADIARVRRLVAAGTFDEEDAADVMPRMRAAVKAAEERLAAIPEPTADVSPLLDMVQSVEAWDMLELGEQRELLALAIKEVRVSPAKGRGYRFDPASRLTIVWADGTTAAPVG